jgi:uncharacterized membrane protein
MRGFRAMGGVFLVLILALVVRTHNLESEDAWIDEVQSIETSQHSTDVLLGTTAFGDVHPPLYYLLLKATSSTLKTGLNGFRWFSVFAGLFTVLLLALPRTQEPFERTLRLSCAGLLALHAGHVHFSQEIRVYAWLCFVLLICLITLRRLIRKPSARRALWAAASMSLSIWLHHVAWIYCAGFVLGLTLFSKLENDQLRWLGFSCALTAVFVAPWFPFLVHQNLGLPEGFKGHIMGAPDLIEVGRVLGPWGGLGRPITVLVGLFVFLWIPGLTIWRQRQHVAPDYGVTQAPRWTWAPLFMVCALVMSLSLVFLIPRPQSASVALEKTLTASTILIMLAPLALFFLPEWLARLRGRSSFQSTHAMVLGVTLVLFLFLLAGRLGESRLFLPMSVLLLEASCVDAAQAGFERRRVMRILPLILVLILPALPSAFVQGKHVQVRPDTKEAMTWLLENSRTTLYVHPCFDAPTFEYSKMRHQEAFSGIRVSNHCKRDEDGRLTLSPPGLGPEQGVVVFTRNSCDAARRLLATDPVLSVSGATEVTSHEMKGLCLLDLHNAD